VFTAQIRYSEGEFVESGQVFFYPRVPLSNSISVVDPTADELGAGTLGCYAVDNTTGDILGITAGHVVASSIDGIVSAPADMPYAEAVKSIEVRLKDEAKRFTKHGPTWLSMQDKLQQYDRRLGTVLLDDVVTVGSDRIDVGLILVDPSRRGDNRLGKVAAYAENYTFDEDGDILRLPTGEYEVGESVVKAGIRTGLTRGRIVHQVSVKWDLLPDTEKCPCHAIIGLDDDERGSGFSNKGDSGSAVVRLLHQVNDGEGKDSLVVRSELVGIVYGMVQEVEKGPIVTTFMPIGSIMDRIRERLNIEIGLDGGNGSC
jgi:hypothetical protein